MMSFRGATGLALPQLREPASHAGLCHRVGQHVSIRLSDRLPGTNLEGVCEPIFEKAL